MPKENINSICFILPGWVTKNTGGAEWQTYHLSEKFVSERWNVEVITSKRTITNPEYINNRIAYNYYNEKILKSRLLGFIKFLFLLKKIKSRIFYTRTDARMQRAALFLFSKFKKIKYYYAIAHDTDLENNPFKNRSSNKNILVKVFHKVDNSIVNYFGDKAFKSTQFIVQTNYQKNYLKDNYNIDSKLIRNSYFSSFVTNEAIKGKGNIVLWVANIRRFKRPELFLEIVNKANNEWFFKMVGDPGYFNEQIKNYSKENFSYKGKLGYRDTEKLFDKARIIINTSTREGFSNTFLEAWAKGVWIITLGVDPDNIISKYGYGEVCESVEEIVGKLDFYDSNEIPQDKLKEAREFVRENFNPETNYQRLKEILN